MATEPKMKVNLTANTAPFQKGMKQAQADVRNLKKVTDESIGSLADAFGVPVQRLESLGSALRGLGTKMESSSAQGVSAFGKLLTSVDKVSMGIAGIGVAAVVAQFRVLNDEADYFLSRASNDWMLAGAKAWRETFKGVMHDMDSDVAGMAANAKIGIGNAWTTGWTVAKDALLGSFQDATGGFASALTKSIAKARMSSVIADQAKGLAIQIDNLNDKMSKNYRDWTKKEAELAAIRVTVYDSQASGPDRLAALGKYESGIKQLYGEQYNYLSQIASKMEAIDSLSENDQKTTDATNQAWTRAYQTQQAMNNELKSMSRVRKTILGIVDAEPKGQNATTEAVRQTAIALAELKKAASESRAEPLFGKSSISKDLTGIGGELATPEIGIKLVPKQSKEEFESLLNVNLGGTILAIGVTISDRKLTDISSEVGSMLSDIAASAGESIGVLVGNLVTGGDAWGSFRSAALGAMGDMAISVGRMAIATGLATLGIKAALESLNGWVAIAAGAALIALGYAVKTGLSNVASGNYNAAGSSSVASSSYGSSTSSSYNTREMEVKVSGTLVASGNTLVAVIQNENKRKNHTT